MHSTTSNAAVPLRGTFFDRGTRRRYRGRRRATDPARGRGPTRAITSFMPLLSRIFLGVAGCVLLVAAALRYERRRSTPRFEKLLEARTRELSELSTHLQNFAEKEKSELARRLHDELGGLLTAAKMDLSWLQSRLDQPPNAQRLTQLGEALDEAMNVKRRVVEHLRPSLLDHFGLATALRAHVESTCAKANLQFESAVDDDVSTVPKDTAIALFRLVQEALTNVIRHADAHRVRLEFRGDTRNYILKLSDDGCGFDMEGGAFSRSHGLSGMRQRIKALHGHFTLRSNSGRGTQIEVEVPRELT
jgi:signal transduction histidine kinase